MHQDGSLINHGSYYSRILGEAVYLWVMTVLKWWVAVRWEQYHPPNQTCFLFLVAKIKTIIKMSILRFKPQGPQINGWLHSGCFHFLHPACGMDMCDRTMNYHFKCVCLCVSGAVDENGRMPFYAEECASMLAVTFSSGGTKLRSIVGHTGTHSHRHTDEDDNAGE